MVETEQKISLPDKCFNKGTDAIKAVLHLWPRLIHNDLPKAPLEKPSHWGLGLQHNVEDTHIQSLAFSYGRVVSLQLVIFIG